MPANSCRGAAEFMQTMLCNCMTEICLPFMKLKQLQLTGEKICLLVVDWEKWKGYLSIRLGLPANAGRGTHRQVVTVTQSWLL